MLERRLAKDSADAAMMELLADEESEKVRLHKEPCCSC